MENVPVSTSGPASAAQATGRPAHTTGHRGNQKKTKMKWIIVAAVTTVFVLMLALVGFLLYRTSTAAHIDASKYQAVFFTNGQVYFGKLERLNGGYFKLNDIFYLQAQATDKAASENPQETTNQSASDVQLVKLGSEIHGPDDEMIMSQDQILFFENLKKDGKVSDSIAKYKAEKK